MNRQEFIPLVERALTVACPDDGYDEDGDYIAPPPAGDLADELLIEIERAGYKLVKA